MLTVLLLAVVTASDPVPVKLAAPGLSYVNLTTKQGEFFADYFAQQLGAQGLTVTTASEIATLLGFERQKQLLGCGDESSTCVAELAGALGADGLIAGSLAKFKGGYTVQLKILAAEDGHVVARAAETVKDEDKLLEVLRDTAVTFAPLVKKALGHQAIIPPPTVAAPPPAVVDVPRQTVRSTSAKVAGFGLLAVGAAGLGVGIYSFVMRSQAADFQRRAAPQYRPLYEPDLNRFQLGSYVGAAVGVAGLVAGGFLAFGGDSSTSPSAALIPLEGGAVAVVGGTLPAF